MLWPEQSHANGDTVIADGNEYLLQLEDKTEKLIKSLEGVSDCTVMITLERGYEYLYASDQTLERTYSDLEILLSVSSEKNYILDGNGQPIVISESIPTVKGIAVVAKGISPDTRYKIISLLQAAYGLPSNRISVES